ncbi:hypothetical protein C8R46DRAFT_1232355 [Mycena filopes]|nr:hypothetical protein C8R46DRAFT_1232355 [Mycena filopes]
MAPRILPRVFAETATPDLDNRASEADDYDLHNTTGYSWAEEQRRSDERAEEGQPAFRPSNCEDAPGDPGHETQFYRAMRAEAESMAADSNSNDLFRYPITPEESDEIILRSNVYWTTESLPEYHRLNPEFRPIHEQAVALALAESECKELLEAAHERLAANDVDAYPGERVQFLAAQVEHSGNICRATETACLSALLKINGTEAYALIDTGSTTNSMTPEFANTTKAPRIHLQDQVTLQLGVAGSRSRINFGTRVAVDFGGIIGYVYFDQVNIDRYDVIIGTPFLNRHEVIVDFGKREIRFPKGGTIHALPLPTEANLISVRNAKRKEVIYGKNKPAAV